MIKFFRNIRRKIMGLNNTGTYVKYAVGEIVLVVLGILIALEINNWNNSRLDNDAELNFYLNFKEQLDEDRNEIEGNILYNTKYMSQFEYAVQIIEENDRTRIDTLSKISMNLTKYSDVSRQSNIYETLVNSGEIQLLNSAEIKEKIRSLEEIYIYINKMEEIHRDVILDEVAGSIRMNFKLNALEVLQMDTIFSVQYQNLIVMIIGIMKEKDEVYNKSLRGIQDILTSIDAEINE